MRPIFSTCAKRFRTHGSVAALVAILLVTAACSGNGSEVAEASTEAATADTRNALQVQAIRAVTKQVSATVQATGGFAAEEDSNVAPEAPGIIIETLVNVGDFVQQGQVIARLNDRDAQLRLNQARAQMQQAEASVRQAQSKIGLGQNQNFDVSNVPEVAGARASYESAQAQLRLAQANANRYANLVKSGDVSQTTYDQARTEVDTAQAQANAAREQFEATQNAARQNYQGVMTQEASLEGMRATLALAEKALDDTRIRAPFAGYVSARPVAAGEYVSASTTVATILRITPIKLELQVPETYSASVEVGMNVEANVSGYPGRNFNGRVTAVNPAVDPASRTFVAEVRFPNPDRALRPGMFATARVVLAGDAAGIFVPSSAVITDATTNSSQVFMIIDETARLAVVQLGERDGDMIRILSGLPDGAVVATDHLADLYDGQPVEANMTSANVPPAGSEASVERRYSGA